MPGQQMRRQPPEQLQPPRALSEAAFNPGVPATAGSTAWPATPQSLRTASRQRQAWGNCAGGPPSPGAGQQRLSGTLRQEDPRVPLALDCDDQTDMHAKMQIMRGVITGPARWRSSTACAGTPALYSAVYKYDLSSAAGSEGSAAAASTSSQSALACKPLPKPQLISSSWGQGPLVIEGVPVPQRRLNTAAAIDSQTAYISCLPVVQVLVVGVFRNSGGPWPSEPASCGRGGGPPQRSLAALPRAADLLGVLYVPLHCVHLTELQQEIKLRLPVTDRLPAECSVGDSGLLGGKEDGDQELALLLSPACSLEKLEAGFKRGLTANTTGVNRCNVMLFRLSGSPDAFLNSSDTLFRAALAAPLTPSAVSTAQRPASIAVQHAASDASKPHHQQQQQPAFDLLHASAEEAAAAPAAARAASPDAGLISTSIEVERHSKLEEAAAYLNKGCRAPSSASPSSAYPEPWMQEPQRQRQKQRQQELSVAAVLAASAIAAAARGERGRSAHSSASRPASEAGVTFKRCQRPSSACSPPASSVAFKGSSCLSLQSQVYRQQQDASARMQQLSASRGLEAAGDLDVSPDDSVSVRGEDAQLLAATIFNRAAGSARGLLSSGLRGRLALPAGDSLLLESSVADDRKSTLSTSIRRLDCLMTRAQLLLSQRRENSHSRETQQQEMPVQNRETDKLQRKTQAPVVADQLQGKALRQPPQPQQAECRQLLSDRSTQDSSARLDEQALTGRSREPLRTRDLAACTAFEAPQLADKAAKSRQLAKAVKVVTASARRRAELLAQELIFKAWLQETRKRMQQRQAAGLCVAAACASASSHSALRRHQLQLGWMALGATAAKSKQQTMSAAWLLREAEVSGCLPSSALSAHQTSLNARVKKQSVAIRQSEEREAEKDLQRQQLSQLVEQLRQELSEKTEKCQQLERRAAEEREKNALEVGGQRQQIAQLQQQLVDSKKETCLAAPSCESDAEEKRRLLQQLEASLQESRQMQRRAADEAAAKARSEEEAARLRKELLLSQKRTKDLEKQLLLVDEQLVAMLKQAVPRQQQQPPQDRAPEAGAARPAALGPWAVQQLQEMRHALEDVKRKKPLLPSADTRRQPPAETELPTPLRPLSRESSVAGERQHPSRALSRSEQQQRVTLQQQGVNVPDGLPGSSLRHRSANAAAAAAPPTEANAALLHAKLRAESPAGRRALSTSVREPQQAKTGQSDEYGLPLPAASGTRLSGCTQNLQSSHQSLLMPHTNARSQHVKEQLDRQRVHRQQLMHMRANHPMQQMQMHQQLQAPPASQLQTSFIAALPSPPQPPVQSFAACPLPMQRLQHGSQQQPLLLPSHMRAPSPHHITYESRARLQARCAPLGGA
ncbi:hypothetical protein Efla_003983 [Eimeria flavescens]